MPILSLNVLASIVFFLGSPSANARDSEGVFRSIIGGQKAASNEAFDSIYGVSIEYENFDLFCTGTLVSRRVVLTGGHCLSGTPPINSIRVFSREGLFFGRRSVSAISWKVHPEFSPEADASNDIALIKIPEEFTFGSKVWAMAKEVPNSKDTYRAYGFGLRGKRNGSIDGKLRYVNYRIVGNAKTLKLIPVNKLDGVCGGDSGGPLVNEAGYIVGVNSRFANPSQYCTPNSVFEVTSIANNASWLMPAIASFEAD